jgi:type VI secretion system protein VasJ
VAGPQDADKAVAAVGKTLREIAQVLRHADPAQAQSYRLHRVGLWLPVKQAPPVVDGRSRLPPPGADDKKRLERLASGRQWVDLVEAAEGLTAKHLFWFDPHRMIAQAMEQLGALFMQANETVSSEVAAFCARIPDVSKGKFNDGTPFADPATESWLQEHALGSGGGGASSVAVSEEDAEIAKRFDEARDLIKQGRLPEGLSLATQLATRGPDARTRFKSRLEIAQMAVLGGQPKVGLAILASLSAEADEHRLEEWEPSLCAQVYSTQVAGLRALDPKERVAEDDKALFRKLSRLDPASALRLSGD